MGARLYESRLGLFLGAEPLYDELHSISPYSYGLNNPVKHKDKDGNFPIDVVLDVAFIVSDVIDIAQTMMKGEAVSGAQWGALAGDVVGAVVPGLTGVGKMVKAGDAAVDAAKGMEKTANEIKLIGPAGDAGGVVMKQLPDDMQKNMRTSDNGGTIFKDPKNPSGNHVRVESGNPKSPNPAQQKPYVKHVKDGKFLDVNGKEISREKPGKTVESHIPKEDFKYNQEK